MIDFKLPVENVVGFTIGDIDVDVDIRFLPRMRPGGVQETIAIDALNQHLGELAWEVKQQVKETIEKKLKSLVPSNPLSKG